MAHRAAASDRLSAAFPLGPARANKSPLALVPRPRRRAGLPHVPADARCAAFVNWDDEISFLRNPHYRGLGPAQLRFDADDDTPQPLEPAHLGHVERELRARRARSVGLPPGQRVAALRRRRRLLPRRPAAARRRLSTNRPRKPRRSPPARSSPRSIVRPAPAARRTGGLGERAPRRALRPLLSAGRCSPISAASPAAGAIAAPVVGAVHRRPSPRRFLSKATGHDAAAHAAPARCLSAPTPRRRLADARLGEAAVCPARGGRRRRSRCSRARKVGTSPAYDRYGVGRPRRADRLHVLVLPLEARSGLLRLAPIYELPARVDPWPVALSDPAGRGLSPLTAALAALRRRWPAGLAAWVSSAIVLAPISGVVHSGSQLAQDRYSYLSGLGFAVLAGRGVHLGHAPILRRAGATMASAPGNHRGRSGRHRARASAPGRRRRSGATRKRCGEEPSRSTRRAPFARATSAARSRARGASTRPTAHVKRAMELRPDRPGPYENLGVIMLDQGRFREAEEHFRRAATLRPDHGAAGTASPPPSPIKAAMPRPRRSSRRPRACRHGSPMRRPTWACSTCVRAATRRRSARSDRPWHSLPNRPRSKTGLARALEKPGDPARARGAHHRGGRALAAGGPARPG